MNAIQGSANNLSVGIDPGQGGGVPSPPPAVDPSQFVELFRSRAYSDPKQIEARIALMEARARKVCFIDFSNAL